jgi:hypothetical protein
MKGANVRTIVRSTAAVLLLLLPSACGGPAQYIQEERPAESVCKPGTQPAVVGLQSPDSTNVWSCLPACPPRHEYVSQVQMPGLYNQSVEPKCERVCPAGWERKLYAGAAVGMDDIMSDVCKANAKTECQPVSEEAKADYEREHGECEGGRRIMAEQWRQKNPQVACMQDCAGAARQCALGCRGTPMCMSSCQETTDACTAQCHSGMGMAGSSPTPATPHRRPQASSVVAPPPRAAGPIQHCVQNPDNNCSTKRFYCDVTHENLEHPPSDTSDGHGNRVCCWSHYHP